MKFLHNKLQERSISGSLRSLSTYSGKTDFFSNDYLGMSGNLEINNRIDEILHQHNLKGKNGSSGSRLLSGNSPFYEETERFLAHYFNAESALVYHSGYDALLGTLSCLPQRTDTVIYDECIHASARDGIRLSMARNYSFPHNDICALEKKIQLSGGQVWVVVESVYSMDGDTAPLNEIIHLQSKYGFSLVVDEAHAGGIMGRDGKGLAFSEELNDKIIRIVTFGKAYGVEGACVLGTETLRDYLINFSRPFIYSTAPSPHFFAAIWASVETLEKAEKDRYTLMSNIRYFKNLFSDTILCNDSPIQILKGFEIEKLKEITAYLQSAGFAIRPIFSPTVPKGQERLRIVLHSFNSQQEIKNLEMALKISPLL